MGYKESILRKRCPKCETMNSYSARFCYKCGEDLDKYPESKTKLPYLIVVGGYFRLFLCELNPIDLHFPRY